MAFRRIRSPKALPARPSLQQIKNVLIDMYSLISERPIGVTTDYTVTGKVDKERLILTNSGAITVTLPASPLDGSEVWYSVTGSPVTFNGNGKTIDGNATIVKTSLSSGILIYNDSDGAWREMSGNSSVDISGPLSAFGDLRVAELSPIFQGSFEYTVDNTELTVNTTVNGASVAQVNGVARLRSGTTTAAIATLRSHQPAKYRPGLGGVMRFTAAFTAQEAGCDSMVGIMDETGSTEAFVNGLAVGYDEGTTFGFHRFANDAITTVAQSAWDDPMDGTGASGMTLDPAQLNVYFIQYQYLGAGAIKLWIESDTTGLPVLAHTIHYTNTATTPSSHNPNYYFYMYVNNKATTSQTSNRCSSYAYFVEGKTQFIEMHQPIFSTGIQQKATVTTEVAILTIQNKSSYASKTNFISVMIEGISLSIEANAANNQAQIRLVKDTSLGGSPSYTDINTSDSVVDFDVAGTTLTGGSNWPAFTLAGKNDKEHVNLKPHQLILNPGETLTIAGTSANSATIDANIFWRELF